MARETLCFTIETVVVERESRICETAVAGSVRADPAVVPNVMVAWSSCSGNQCAEYYWGVQLQFASRLPLVG